MPSIVCNVVDVYVFRRRADVFEFLLLKRAPGQLLSNTWQAVHGRIEAGETAVAAALRELREETGLRPLGFWQIDYVNTFFVVASDSIMMCPCFAVEVGVEDEVRLSPEHTEADWAMYPDVLGQLIWPGQRQAVKEIMAEIVGARAGERHLRIALDEQTGSAGP